MKKPSKLSDAQCAALTDRIPAIKMFANLEIAHALAKSGGPPVTAFDRELLAERALIALGVELVFASAGMRARREGRRDAFRAAVREAQENLSDLDRIYLDWKAEKDSGLR